MKVSVFGMGYVGCVTAACLAKDGHEVYGVDVNPVKVEQLASGHSPIIEPGLEEIIHETVDSKRLRVTLDSHHALLNTDISLVCVGTPSNGNGSLDLKYVKKVCEEIGTSLDEKDDYHVVVIRSTVLPSTVRKTLIPILEEKSGLRAGIDFGVCMNPEFLREGSAIRDYYQPSYVVIGEIDEQSGELVDQLYENVDANIIRTSIETAEMVKYVSNTFHALKIAFANEVGILSKSHGVDGQEVMEIFVQDKLLNTSSAYLRPGFAFGGSCLPKDLRALLYRAKEHDLDLPVIDAVLESNEKQIQRGIKMIEQTGRNKIGVLGLSFKAGTDDVRESPAVPLIETLIGRGYQVAVYDDTVKPEMLIGSNRVYLERELPHIASIMRLSVNDLLKEAEVVVLANGSKKYHEVPKLIRPDQKLIDLVGTAKNGVKIVGEYEGIGW